MSTPATTVAGPRPSSTDLDVLEGLRAELQQLRHSISFALPALARTRDHLTDPAHVALLDGVINDLRDVVASMNGTNP